MNEPASVPGPVLVSSLVLSPLTALRERGNIDRRGVAIALGGRLPGAALAGLALDLLPRASAGILIGVALVCQLAP